MVREGEGISYQPSAGLEDEEESMVSVVRLAGVEAVESWWQRRCQGGTEATVLLLVAHPLDRYRVKNDSGELTTTMNIISCSAPAPTFLSIAMATGSTNHSWVGRSRSGRGSGPQLGHWTESGGYQSNKRWNSRCFGLYGRCTSHPGDRPFELKDVFAAISQAKDSWDEGIITVSTSFQ